MNRLNSRKYVAGPDGVPITLQDLPSADTHRWVPRRKAIVVAAVKGGLITLEEACSRYALSADELISWEKALRAFGCRGLRSTQIQYYRACAAARLSPRVQD
jgi:hypothetical protein